MADIAVFHEGRPVGTIERRDEGPSFAYDPAWLRAPDAFPISLQMPLSPGRVPPEVFGRWAAGLLPGGARLRALAGQLGKASGDTIGILVHTGRDTPGALCFGEAGPLDPGGWTPVVGEAALEHILDGLLQDPPSADDVSASLPGKRPKLPVALDADRRICLPRGGTPSTHVLKPGSEHLFGGVQNEALCLVLARRCGLAAAPVTTGRAGSGTYLLTERYDRVGKGGRWHRLHQESFAQALGVSPERGSEQEGSRAAVPTLADLLALARCVMCAPDVLALIDQFIFNALVGNPDTGADSFALMICASGITLAPMHGVACVAAWDGISPLLGGMIAGAHVGASEWEAFAAECGLNAGRLLARMETLAGAVLSQARDAAAEVAAMPAGPHLLLARLVEAIETRARHHRAVAERYCGPDRRKAGADRRGSPPLLTVVSSNG